MRKYVSGSWRTGEIQNQPVQLHGLDGEILDIETGRIMLYRQRT